MQRIVVQPIGFLRDYLFEEAADVLNQRILPLVEKHGSGGMQRLQVHNPVANSALADDLIDAVGDVSVPNSGHPYPVIGAVSVES
jgi:hypothetical protein